MNWMRFPSIFCMGSLVLNLNQTNWKISHTVRESCKCFSNSYGWIDKPNNDVLDLVLTVDFGELFDFCRGLRAPYFRKLLTQPLKAMSPIRAGKNVQLSMCAYSVAWEPQIKIITQIFSLWFVELKIFCTVWRFKFRLRWHARLVKHHFWEQSL